jgi:hypothetical protein
MLREDFFFLCSLNLRTVEVDAEVEVAKLAAASHGYSGMQIECVLLRNRMPFLHDEASRRVAGWNRTCSLYRRVCLCTQAASHGGWGGHAVCGGGGVAHVEPQQNVVCAELWCAIQDVSL